VNDAPMRANCNENEADGRVGLSTVTILRERQLQNKEAWSVVEMIQRLSAAIWVKRQRSN
jgi:hypothetical protein